MLFNICIRLYLFSMAVYAGLTTPCLLIPPMYIESLKLALVFGSCAVLFFTGLLWGISFYRISWHIQFRLLYAAVGITVLTSFQLITWTGWLGEIWGEPIFLAFPFAAALVGCFSVYYHRKQIIEYLESKA